MIELRADGVYNTLFGDFYAPRQGALLQAEEVFLRGNRLFERFCNEENLFVIGELGFGFGVNFCHTASVFLKLAPLRARLFFVSCELYLPSRELVSQVYSYHGLKNELSEELLQLWPSKPFGYWYFTLARGRIALLLLKGAVPEVWEEFYGVVDAWYFDGFAPAKNKEMWSTLLFKKLREFSHAETTFATYSVAVQVRQALHEAGCSYEKISGFPGKKEILVGKMNGLSKRLRYYPSEAFVAGAGIAGSALSYSLARRSIRVKLYDPHREPHGASGNRAALVMPLLAHPQDIYARLIWRSYSYLCSHFGRESFYLKRTFFYIARGRKLSYLESFPFDYRSKGEGQELFLEGALVLSREFCFFLREFHSSYVEFLEKGYDGPKNMSWLFWALGEKSVDELSLYSLPVERYGGELYTLPASAIGGLEQDKVYLARYYIFALENSWYVGGSYYLQGKKPEGIGLKEMVQELQSCFHFSYQEKGAEVRRSIRLVSRDRLPILGPLPGASNVGECAGPFLFTAFGSRGFTLGPLLAEALVSFACGEPLPIEKSLFFRLFLTRFLSRGFKIP
ncbi:MAG: tRNA (5-methylaminomethyl-2-thiouridine)(34)-methyltransferase MnmD [Leptospiraceae bacterium]|nr:tRNA (5-methylaminomethyl-2-thiouridine)(34)-methyltransferase MnmD [Leptospiraceae bacterium]MDW8305557.1 tRNA (5-methylaminomethyl-2-thiouridine)(34)-methyltransferase MnmD [Leptospiraceae bacterium]